MEGSQKYPLQQIKMIKSNSSEDDEFVPSRSPARLKPVSVDFEEDRPAPPQPVQEVSVPMSTFRKEREPVHVNEERLE